MSAGTSPFRGCCGGHDHDRKVRHVPSHRAFLGVRPGADTRRAPSPLKATVALQQMQDGGLYARQVQSLVDQFPAGLDHTSAGQEGYALDLAQ